MSSDSKLRDALIVGGGPAGLSAALGLARQHKSCVLFSDATFSNKGAHAMHGVISRDGEAPEDFRQISREQVAKYGNTTFVDLKVAEVKKESDEGRDVFRATDLSGQVWSARKLVIASGSVYKFPNIDGIGRNWPTNIYPCLICDGHERAHMTKGILGFPNAAHLKLAMMAKSISEEASMVTIFLNGKKIEDDDTKRALEGAKALGFKVEPRRIYRLKHLEKGLKVRVEGGDDISVGFLVYRPESAPGAANIIQHLGLEVEETPMGKFVKRSEPFGATNVKGVFTCGDAAALMKHVTQAMAQGLLAGAGIVMELHDEEIEEAFKEAGL